MAQNEEIIKKLIAEIAEEQNFADYNLVIESVSSGGANYTSHLYDVTVEESKNVHYLFAKVAAIGEKMRTQAPKVYDTEIFVYTKLAKLYDQIQDEFQVPLEHRLTLTKFYGYNPNDYKETLILQNLVKDGYEAYDRFKSITWEYSKSSVTEIAKMHALSFAYAERNLEEFNQVIEDRKIEWDLGGGQMLAYFETALDKAKGAVASEHAEKFRKHYEKIQITTTFKENFKWIRRPVLGHGDYRPSNLMHRNREDGTVDIKIVDLQTLQGTSPVIDLLNFIFTGSDEQFRAQYFDKLIDHYYTQLSAAMRRLHLDPDKIYSREDFDYELKEKLPFGLTIAVFALPVLTVAAEDAPQVNEDMDMSSFVVEKTSDLYTERLNGVINDYVKWGVLK